MMENVKNAQKISDVILLRLNKINEGKHNGGIKNTEFAEELELTGNLIANSIRLGKLNNNDIESVKNYLTIFTGENKHKYFSYPHVNQDKAASIALRNIAIVKQEKTNALTQPTLNEEGYTKAFIRS